MLTIEQGEFHQGKEQHPRFRAWMLLDLDGVILRWVNAHTPNAGDQAQMLATLKAAKEADVGIAVLTNRPPGQMPAIAYDLGIDYGVWVTESGGSLYTVRDHKSMIAPEWFPIAPSIKSLRQHLKDALGVNDIPASFDEPQFEPGMGLVKTVLIPPRGTSPAAFAQNVQQVLVSGSFDELFTIHAGKAVDVDPVGLSKEQGMETLLEINAISPTKTPVLWIADHDRDIAAGRALVVRGGMVAAVGNASIAYREFVSNSGGIMAPETTSYHNSVTHIVQSFLTDL